MGLDDDQDIEWNGWLARVVRPTSARTLRQTFSSIAVLYFAGAASLAPIAFGWVSVMGTNVAALRVLAVVALVTGVASVCFRFVPVERYAQVMPFVNFGSSAASVGVITALVIALGPNLGVGAIFFVEMPVLQFMLLRRAIATIQTGFMMVAYAIALATIDGVAAPAVQWAIVLTSAVATGVLVGRIANRLDDARQQLSALNGRLRRFLAPQVADALTAGEEALAPHRREIAVFFVDLRGFTAFTNASTPDRVVAVLDEYYAAVGELVDKYRGTIGGFDGDGVFAFLGDPVPNENSAADAIAMAKEVAAGLDRLTPGWGDLGYGIGVAFGEATIGLVGFEGRIDYTPVGACVNLAARLCADAKHGQIVVDDALRHAAALDGSVVPRGGVDLKGFGIVETYTVGH